MCGKTPFPNLCEEVEGFKSKIYCQATICQTCVLAVLWIIKVGLAKVGNQAKPLKYSEKTQFVTNCDQMFKYMATDLDTQPMLTQRRLTCTLKNARWLADAFCTVSVDLCRVASVIACMVLYCSASLSTSHKYGSDR